MGIGKFLKKVFKPVTRLVGFLFGGDEMAQIIIPPPAPAPKVVEKPPTTVAEQVPAKAAPTLENAEMAVRQRQEEEKKRRASRRALSRQESIIAGKLGLSQVSTGTKTLLGE